MDKVSFLGAELRGVTFNGTVSTSMTIESGNLSGSSIMGVQWLDVMARNTFFNRALMSGEFEGNFVMASLMKTDA